MTAPNNRERILPRLIHEEIKESFINYSMSVIVSRALPDVRDGLKPVHRRVLYAMNELGLVPGRPYKKSATVVGDVLGKYHPHGDQSVYDALVRMVQDFSLRYPLVDGQGNFGSVDGDPAAAYRYTESRLTRVAVEMLADIDKNTVDFAPNFDDRLLEPKVLPSAIPNLVVNGSSGIAVGMATNIPPHNLNEVVAAITALIDGQGNFGSVDGDNAAAYRYTESRLMPIAMEMLADIDKNTVNTVPNFDDTREEPAVLPSGIPNLVVNGSSGIAVGMATNIPPHNLREVVNAIIHIIDNPEATPGEIRKFIKGPDFPTAGYIYGRAGIKDYQETGRGRIVMRARAVIEEKESSNKAQIVVTEFPYQVNPAKLEQNIAELVRDKKLDGISDLRNESDRDGLRLAWPDRWLHVRPSGTEPIVRLIAEAPTQAEAAELIAAGRELLY